MVSEKDFHKILEEKGVIKNCRDIWWKCWEKYQKEFGGNRELLENIVTVVIEKGCKASCYS